jgi:hypothetical protein
MPRATAEDTASHEVLEETGEIKKLTREELVEKLRRNNATQNVEPVTLEGMLGIGKPVGFGNVTLYIPALTVRQFTKALTLINEISSAGDEDTGKTMNQMMEVIHMAVSRNYPDITLEELLDLIDLSNLQDVFQQVLQSSNITVKNE